MTTSRERVELVLNHQEPDRVPVDLGGSAVTGMHVSVVYGLRQKLALDPPGTPVKVVEPYQMLGEIKLDLMDALGIDVVPLSAPATMFGFKNEDWKRWTTFDSTPVLVPGGFNTEVAPDGSLYMYPEDDKSVPPSGKMPAGGWYFDSIVRQPPIDEEHLDVEDNLEEFGPISSDVLEHFSAEAERLYTQTDKAIMANFGGTGFGDIALIPAPWLKHPKGIRDIEEWYVSTVSRRDYVYRVFERQCDIALENLQAIFGVVGNRVAAVLVTGTDFGTQRGPFLSNRTYRKLYQPFHRKINDWIHSHTTWKSFIHSCGSVRKLIPDFIDAGFDILNPVQSSATGMDPRELKAEYGDQLTFWGGGIDTQKTLPFGSVDDVKAEVAERLQIFGPGGGFVFNSIHNVQPLSPVDNVLAVYRTIQEHGAYPLQIFH
ncbi:MAG: uroporphyrinogen decarboxylase family protein [Anaerolineae bacterium]|nr:uroporphyrinogen decarboxylase family protein [Anaerolineae bacterium]